MTHLFLQGTGVCRPGRDERRVMCRALMRWETLRDEDQLPLDGQFDLRDDADLAPHFYWIRLSDPVPRSTVEHCGPVLADICGGAPAGRPVCEVLPVGVRERMIDFFNSAACYRQVLADSGSFIGHRGEILYRNIIMPLQDTAGTVVSLAGAINYRIEE